MSLIQYDKNALLNNIFQIFRGVAFGYAFAEILNFHEIAKNVILIFVIIEFSLRYMFTVSKIVSFSNFLYLPLKSINLFKYFLLESLLNFSNFAFLITLLFKTKSDLITDYIFINIVVVVIVGNTILERGVRLFNKKTSKNVFTIGSIYALLLFFSVYYNNIIIVSAIIFVLIYSTFLTYKKFILI